MPEYPLDKPFVRIIECWLPDDPERKVSGTLTYENQKTTIQLQDSFTPFSGDVQVSDTQQYPVVNAVTDKAEAISLIRVVRAGQSLNFNSGGHKQAERLVSTTLLVGGYATGEIQYGEMRFRTPGLLMWNGVAGVTQELKGEGEAFETTYRVSQVPKYTHHSSEIDAELEIASSSNHGSNAYSSISVDVHGWLIIRPSEPQTLDWYLRQHRKVAKFLMLCAGFSMSPDMITAKTDDLSVSLLVDLVNFRLCDRKDPRDFFLIRRQIGIELEDALSNWFNLYEGLHTPSALFESLVASERSLLHIELLTLMQALEGLHRALHEGTYMLENDYMSVRDVLTAAIPTDVTSDHRDSLKSRIRYGNQVSLAKRLKELSEYFDTPLRTRLLGSKEVPRTWIDTRNYFTHWDEDCKRPANPS